MKSIQRACLFAILLIIPMSVNAHEFLDTCEKELQLLSDVTSAYSLLSKHALESMTETIKLATESVNSGINYNFREIYVDFVEVWLTLLKYTETYIRTNSVTHECYERSHRDKHHQIK